MSDREALEPCPFCGSNAVGIYLSKEYWSALCTDCSGSVSGPTSEMASSGWNRRASREGEESKGSTLAPRELITIASELAGALGELLNSAEIADCAPGDKELETYDTERRARAAITAYLKITGGEANALKGSTRAEIVEELAQQIENSYVASQVENNAELVTAIRWRTFFAERIRALSKGRQGDELARSPSAHSAPQV